MTPHLYQNCLAITAPLDMRSVCRTGGYVQTRFPEKWPAQLRNAIPSYRETDKSVERLMDYNTVESVREPN